MDDPWAILDDGAFGDLIMSDDPIDTEFVNMIPFILNPGWEEDNE